MKKSKTMFSPRKLIYWLLIIILIFTVPNINAHSMGKTNAIVTLLSVDTSNGSVKVCANIIKPSSDGGMCCEKYTAENATLGEAIEDLGYSIGKDLAFSQCEVMAFGDEIASEGIMSSLDYMTRVKKVSRNTLLINIGGEIDDFNQAVIDMSKNKRLKIEEMLGFANKYSIGKEHSIETFYQKYYSPLGQTSIPKLEIGDAEKQNAIEVSTTAGGGQTNEIGGGQGGENKKFLQNDGKISVFVKGKKTLEVDKFDTQKLSLLGKNGYRGTIRVENVNDELYDNATLLFQITNGKADLNVKFDGDKPKVEVKLSLLTFIEEVIEENPDKRFLTRMEKFMSTEAQNRLKETVKGYIEDAITYSKTYELDLFDIYSRFDKFHHKQTKEQLKNKSILDFLKSIEYNIKIDVKSTY